MSLIIRMSATPTDKPNIDKIIKSNKRLRAAAHSSKTNRKHHRVAIDQLDSFLDLIDNAMDVMNNTTVEIKVHKRSCISCTTFVERSNG